MKIQHIFQNPQSKSIDRSARPWQGRLVLFLPLFLVALAAALVSARSAYAHDDVVIGPDGKSHSPVEITLSADRAPGPGETVNLLLSVTSHTATPTMKLVWQLDKGGELLGGAAETTLAAVTAQQPVQQSRQVRFPTAGIYQVTVAAQIQPTAGLGYGAADVLFFVVAADGTSTMTRVDPTVRNPMRSTMTTSARQLDPAVSAAQSNGDDPCYTISGQVTRLERSATTTGYTNSTVPVRFAHIELMESDPIFDDSIDEGITDANGNYSFSFCDDDGIGDTSLELYLILYTSIYAPGKEDWDDFEVVYVEDSSWIDEMYEYNSGILNVDNGGSYDLSVSLDSDQSGPFNIADAIYDAWNFWRLRGGASGGDTEMDITAEVHWEPGYVESDPALTTFYDGAQEEITVSALTADDDTWDDSAIIHEYGHMIEDNYSCDESLGGAHSFTQILADEEFSWSEGFANYFQSAVRNSTGAPNGDWYLDWAVPNASGAIADLENWDTNNPTLASRFNEIGIAALFWDLNDSANDGQDRVAHGPAMVQEVYTDDEFNSQWGDEECSVNEYFRAWQALDKPADAATAAVIAQNTGVANPFTVVSADAASEQSEYTLFTAHTANNAQDYQWWRHLIMVNDLSQSMAGAKLNAVKSVLTEQVNDIATTPKGVEFSLYSFNNTQNSNQTLLAGKFYPEFVTPAISAMTTSAAADGTCPVESLRALSQAIGPKQRGNAWLFTDGDALQSVSVETLVQLLNKQRIKGSVALLGGCNSLPPAPTNVSGAAKNALGLAANAAQQGGIVPYLLTAIGSGGQFLYVAPAQVNDAAAILRAQLSHSAGAGRWSDYVSDQPTYLYDKLTSWEYQWIDTSVAAGGVNQGIPSPQVSLSLPAPFTFYGTAQTMAHVTRHGYLTFGPTAQAAQINNTPLPAAALPNNALYILWDELFWNNPPAVVAAANAPDAPSTPNIAQVNVFSRQAGDWFALETNGTGAPAGDQRAYQILLNATTGEIRYQYKSILSGEAGVATIGLENSTGTAAVQVSHNDNTAASNTMGYKFTPAPAQPSKVYTAAVDGLVSSIGFLLTGYSGSFDPLLIQTPDNSQVTCAESANVLCLNLGLVQYVQVKVNGRKGIWRATVSAGGSGAGTFSFSTIGASSITAESKAERSRSTGPQSFDLTLEKAVAGNVLTAWFTKPNGVAFGNPFRFFDDGAHNDGKPGDGRFGSEDFAPPGAGMAYLWVQGTVDGESFIRNEPTPFTFQPLEVTALGNGVNYGGITSLVFSIKNNDTVDHCYTRSTQVPSGWAFDCHMPQNELNFGLCIAAGQTVTRPLEVRMAAGPSNNLPSGASGEVFVTFIEREAGTISASTSALVTRYRAPAYLVINNKSLSSYLRPTGVDTTTLSIFVYDDQNVSVADGVEVKLTSTLGTITPATALTQKGRVDPVFTAGSSVGSALITVMVGNLVATTTVQIQAPMVDNLVLTTTHTTLPAGANSATITALARDQWGDPLANETVRLAVSGDGTLGSLNGNEVITGTTDANGQLSATFTRGSQTGTALILAELLTVENGQTHAALKAKQPIVIAGEAPSFNQQLFLPLVTR
ncbi:MAG: hypothetical protein KF832_11905 [Caldilineaceae bacterium]|nr:hypothetical protein [Caldilineaceae bacterium]